MVPPLTVQFTTPPAMPFPNASTSFTLSGSVDPLTAAGLSEPNFCRPTAGPTSNSSVNVLDNDPIDAITCARPGFVPGVYVTCACPSASVVTLESLNVPPPSTTFHRTSAFASGEPPPPVTTTTRGCAIATPTATF